MSQQLRRALTRRTGGARSDEGFTLIELLVVVIIIGVLAAIAVPIYIGVQNNAKDSAVKSDVTEAKLAVAANAQKNNGTIVSSLSGLSSGDGYSTPTTTAGDYSGSAGFPVLSKSSSGLGYCISAISVTGMHFAASDATGVATGTCTAGAFVSATS